jgi:hypothetical protein
MSNTEAKEPEKNALQEVLKTVAITPEDCSGAADFWTHFEVPMPQALKDAFATFAKEPTFENQQIVKLEVCRAIGYTDHEAFKDEMFTEIVEECRNVTYDMGFDKELEATLTTAEENTATTK